MKNLLVLLSTLIVAVACQQGDGSGSNNVLVSPMSNSLACINGAAYCDNSAYAGTYGWMPYPGMYNYAFNYMAQFSQQGFCACPVGYLPTYNGSLGLGCISSQLLDMYGGYYISWQITTWSYGAPAPQTQTNFPQFSNIPNAVNSVSSCMSTLTQACLLNQPYNCDIGATCRQTVPGSVLGICVRN